eukprot:4773476-Prymnesium_polylepis.2
MVAASAVHASVGDHCRAILMDYEGGVLHVAIKVIRGAAGVVGRCSTRKEPPSERKLSDSARIAACFAVLACHYVAPLLCPFASNS